MDQKRVVVTGMGLVSALGQQIEEYWQNLVEGRSGIKKITSFDVSDLPSQIGGEITDFDPQNYMDKREARRIAKFTQFAIASSRLALEYAGFKDEAALSKIDNYRVGVNIGTGIGGIDVFADNVLKYQEQGWKKVWPLFIPATISNMASGVVAKIFQFKGPNYCIVSACATSNHSIQDAYHTIRRGEADMMLTGGVESALMPLAIAGFCSARALSTKRNDTPEEASRPFDKDRDGFVMSEGGGILILESLEHAQKRGAEIYAEVVGSGMSCDAHHFTEPDPEGMGARNSMLCAIKSAGIEITDIDVLNTHGTSTIVGDIAELKSIKLLFGEHAPKLYINSTKSMVGHLLGAAGSFEAIACIQMMRTGTIHPTINLHDPIEEAQGLNLVPNKAVKADVNYVLSNSFGFGGQNCSLVLKKYSE